MADIRTVSLSFSLPAMDWLRGSTAGTSNFSFLEWMIRSMATTPTELNIRGNRIPLSTGQANASVRSASINFGHDRSTISDIYDRMVQLGLIELVPMGRVTTLVNLRCVYGWYNGSSLLRNPTFKPMNNTTL